MMLYAITDDKLTPKQTVLEQVRCALVGGTQYVQLRDKHSDYNEALNIACALQDLCVEFDAKFIVNDNVRLAKDSNAHGVHLGESDDGIKLAKDTLGDKIIGSSCYGSLERGINAIQNGATYIAFGSIFSSPTKPHSSVVPISVIADAKKLFSVPICAIGGIDLQNAKSVKDAGADMIAVISSLWSVDDITKRAREFCLV